MINKNLKFLYIGFLITFLNFSVSVGEIIKDIKIDGNQRISKETILVLGNISKGSDFRITPLGILIQREMAWGPFEKKNHAEYMIPSLLDEDGRDWKG